MMRRIVVVLFALFFAAACSDTGTFEGEDGGGTGGVGDAGPDVTEEDTGGGETTGDTETDSGEDCPPDEREDWLPDEDGDGFGDESAEPTTACEQPEGMVVQGGDCDDEDDTVHPGADEICNGVDDDCDGVADADEDQVEPGDCSNQDGVCEGATIAECAESGDEYAQCGPAEYSANDTNYREADDEAWRCDGADNDCDGETDEACCGAAGNDAEPAPVAVGDDGADQANPVLVPAANGAPQDAAYLAAWAVGSEVRLQHLGENGADVGGEETNEDPPNPVQSIDVVQSNSGYVVAFTVDQGTGIVPGFVATYDTDLNNQDLVQLESGGDTANNISVAAQGQTAWVAYAKEDGSEVVVPVASVNLMEGTVGAGPTDVSSTELLNTPAPEIAVIGGTPTVVWWNGNDDSVRGARFQNGSRMDGFDIEVGTTGAEVDEALELVAGDGNGTLVYPDFESGKAVLHFLEIAPGDTGTLSGATAITGDSEHNRQSSATPVDLDADGTADELLVTWAQGEKTDPAIVAGTTPFESPEVMEANTVNAGNANLTLPDVSSSDGQAGATYLRTDGTDNVHFVPLSIDGVPICAE